MGGDAGGQSERGSPSTFRLAHLSDLHLGRRVERRERPWMDRLLEALREARADHVVHTGDLTERGSAACVRWFEALCREAGFDRARLTVVPGNHDMDARDEIARLFRSCTGGPRLLSNTRIGIVGLDSTHWNGLPGSLFDHPRGELGAHERSRLARALREAAGCATRIVALHHHVNRAPISGLGEAVGSALGLWEPLEDREELFDLCEEHGVDLVLSGHAHAPREYLVERGRRAIRCFIAGSTREEEAFRVLSFDDGLYRGWRWWELWT